MRTTFNFDWIDERLAVGGSFPMEAAEQLARREAIGAVVDLRIERCDDEAVLRISGLEFLHLPTEDCCAIAPRMIDDGVAWVRGHMDVRRVRLAGLRPPPPVSGGDVERVLRGVDRTRLRQDRGAALQRVGGEVHRCQGQQTRPGGRAAEGEVGAAVGDRRRRAARDLQLSISQPVVEGAATDDFRSLRAEVHGSRPPFRFLTRPVPLVEGRRLVPGLDCRHVRQKRADRVALLIVPVVELRGRQTLHGLQRRPSRVAQHSDQTAHGCGQSGFDTEGIDGGHRADRSKVR